MSIYYDLYENPKQEDAEEQKLLHARVVPSGTYTTKEFVERVSMMHHIPHAQLVGAVEAITDELQTLLSRGYIVEFGDLGHFSLTLSLEKEIIDRKEVRSPSIRLKNIKLKVPFRVSMRLNKSKAILHFYTRQWFLELPFPNHIRAHTPVHPLPGLYRIASYVVSLSYIYPNSEYCSSRNV